MLQVVRGRERPLVLWVPQMNNHKHLYQLDPRNSRSHSGRPTPLLSPASCVSHPPLHPHRIFLPRRSPQRFLAPLRSPPILLRNRSRRTRLRAGQLPPSTCILMQCFSRGGERLRRNSLRCRSQQFHMIALRPFRSRNPHLLRFPCRAPRHPHISQRRVTSVGGMRRSGGTRLKVIMKAGVLAIGGVAPERVVVDRGQAGGGARDREAMAMNE